MADLKLSKVPTVDVGMTIHRPAERVFEAFVDPAITTKFWFTKSSGKLAPGATVQWDWEMYGVSAEVVVKEFDENRRLVFDWGPKGSSSKTTVTMRFLPAGDDSYLDIKETGYEGSGDEVVARALDSTGGFTMVVSAMKALLEHDAVLTVVGDKAPPKGVEV